MSRTPSPAGASKRSGNTTKGNTFTVAHKFVFYDLSLAEAYRIVTKNPSAGWEAHNQEFRQQQGAIEAAHANTFNYTPGYFTKTQYSKVWLANALRKMPVQLFWTFLHTEITSPTTATINMRFRIRDEFDLSKGDLYILIENLQDSHNYDIDQATYETAKDSKLKFRQSKPTVYHDRQEMLALRSMCCSMLTDDNALDDTDNDNANANASPVSAEWKSTVKVELKSAINRVADQEHREAAANSSPLSLYHGSIDFQSAVRTTSCHILDIFIELFCFGHRMPPGDSSAEYHQCFALCLGKVLNVTSQQVRSEMKVASMEFTTTSGNGYDNLSTGNKVVCASPAQMSSLVSPLFLKYFTLPCLNARSVVVLTHNPDCADVSGKFMLDSFANVPGSLDDNAILLFQRYDHYYVARLPERTFPTVRSFVEWMEVKVGVVHVHHTIAPAPPNLSSSSSSAFTTPSRGTTNTNAPSIKSESVDSYGFARTSGDSSSQKPISLLSDSETESAVLQSACGTAKSEAATATTTTTTTTTTTDGTSQGNDVCGLMMHTGRGKRSHTLLDEQGVTDYKAKMSYMTHLMHAGSRAESGAHIEANSKVPSIWFLLSHFLL